MNEDISPMAFFISRSSLGEKPVPNFFSGSPHFFVAINYNPEINKQEPGLNKLDIGLGRTTVRLNIFVLWNSIF